MSLSAPYITNVTLVRNRPFLFHPGAIVGTLYVYVLFWHTNSRFKQRRPINLRRELWDDRIESGLSNFNTGVSILDLVDGSVRKRPVLSFFVDDPFRTVLLPPAQLK